MLPPIESSYGYCSPVDGFTSGWIVPKAIYAEAIMTQAEALVYACTWASLSRSSRLLMGVGKAAPIASSRSIQTTPGFRT